MLVDFYQLNYPIAIYRFLFLDKGASQMLKDKLAKTMQSPRDKVAIAVLSLIYAFCFVVGWQIDSTDHISPTISLLVIPVSIAFFIILSVLWALLDRRKSIQQKTSCFAHPAKASIIAGAIILICWIPILLAGYPGFFAYDAGLVWLGQWSQVEEGVLNAHHPVLHTLF